MLRSLTQGALDVWPCFGPGGAEVIFSRCPLRGAEPWRTRFLPALLRGSGFRLHRVRVDAPDAASPLGPRVPRGSTRPSCRRDMIRVAFCVESRVAPAFTRLSCFDGSSERTEPIEARGLSVVTGPLFYPSWSGDGKRLVATQFSFRHPTHGGVLRVVNLVERSCRALTSSAEIFAGKPSFSPLGDRVVFAGHLHAPGRVRPKKNRIWICSLDGELRRVEPGQGRAPDWSPDGTPDRLRISPRKRERWSVRAVRRPCRRAARRRGSPRFEIDARHPAWSARRSATSPSTHPAPDGSPGRVITVLDVHPDTGLPM